MFGITGICIILIFHMAHISHSKTCRNGIVQKCELTLDREFDFAEVRMVHRFFWLKPQESFSFLELSIPPAYGDFVRQFSKGQFRLNEWNQVLYLVANNDHLNCSNNVSVNIGMFLEGYYHSKTLVPLKRRIELSNDPIFQVTIRVDGEAEFESDYLKTIGKSSKDKGENEPHSFSNRAFLNSALGIILIVTVLQFILFLILCYKISRKTVKQEENYYDGPTSTYQTSRPLSWGTYVNPRVP